MGQEAERNHPERSDATEKNYRDGVEEIKKERPPKHSHSSCPWADSNVICRQLLEYAYQGEEEYDLDVGQLH